MGEIGTFFDDNSEFYDQHLLKYDYYFMNFMKGQNKQKFSLLDVGGGSGNFSKLILQNYSDVDITILDPSKRLLDKISETKIRKVVGKLPYTDLKSKFDYVHIKEVLHHITGSNVAETTGLLKRSLIYLNDILSEDGFLLVHELFYEGHIIPKLPSNLIFHLLRIQNKLNVKIPVDEAILGLNIYFYTRKDLISAIEDGGFDITEIWEEDFANTTKKKFMLIKNWGRILIVAKKSRKT